MFNNDRIRFQLLRARETADDKERGDTIAHLLATALVDARKSGDATEGVLIGRYGFTAGEIATYRQRATDAATRAWVGGDLVEA